MAKRERFASASEVAELGFCERRLQLRRELGDRASADKVIRRAQGDDEHRSFHKDALAVGVSGSRRCFVATAVFGEEATETKRLRRFRDEVLQHSKPGRALIGWYYAAGPWMAKAVGMVPGATRATRVALRLVVRMIGR